MPLEVRCLSFRPENKEAVERAQKRNLSHKPGFWPQWRGPNRDNISTDTGLLKEWPKERPPLLWKAEELGDGFPSVAVADGGVYLVGYQDESEHVIAMEEATGRKLWETEIKTGLVSGYRMSVMNQRTPTVDDDRLCVVARNGRLICLNTANGKLRWQCDFVEEFAGTRGFFGYGTFPLIDSERLICTPGGDKSPVVALDKMTGKMIWKSVIPQVRRPGHSAIVVAEVGGVRQYIQNFSEGTVAVAADDGRFLWHYGRVASGASNSKTPVVLGDRVLCTNGWGTGIGLLQLAAEGRSVQAKELYFHRLLMEPWHDNSVVVDDHLFFCQQNSLTCFDIRTGKTVWRTRHENGGRPRMTCSDGHLYLHGNDGTASLVEANTKQYVEKSVVRAVNGVHTSFTFPVVTGGRLYLRHWGKLYCYDVTAGSRLSRPALGDPVRPITNTTIPDSASEKPNRTLRSVFVPTPEDVVEKMLELAGVKKTDVVYDLGSGDARIVITAARKYGARAVGYEIDRELVELSRENVAKFKVESLVTIHHKDLFTADLTDADIVAVYLLPKQLEKLLPQLEKLKPGARIVSHQFPIPGVEVQQAVEFESNEDRTKHRVYMWTTPLQKVKVTK